MKIQKNILLVTSALISIVLLIVAYSAFVRNDSKIVTPVESNYKNATYAIDGETIQLKDGNYNGPSIDGSASLATHITYFGNEVHKDINGDGKDDTVFIVTKTTGGSGVFFYALAAITSPQGYLGSQGLLIGDRIAPQTTESGPGTSIIINYVDRANGEGFTTKPSVGKSLRLILNPSTMQFGEVVQDFEGEADPDRMSLTMKKWNLEKFESSNNLDVKNKNAFNLTFQTDGKVLIGTDCNQAQGTYTSTKNKITIDSIVITEMYCQDSDEQLFIKNIQEATEYLFTSYGQLILKGKVSSIYFR